MRDLFFWTECFNCPELIRPVSLSFMKHHPNLELNVFCFEDESGGYELQARQSIGNWEKVVA